ncbi:hypothetical protein GOP47_0015925 [Adiantum capillus-veneris]|uniref:protein-serine/threonine phosphatase n=1 Tax=Adiantum capillus-veneris TaxID=13818 RepID=A0A9D4ZC26_ADICA|nr:hypothetical protein GOP47_0015925 [Adiantum capillus-veneris]
MECSIGDIDLNRAHIDTMSDGETQREDHGSMEGMGVPQQEDGLGLVGSIEDSNAVQRNEVNEAPKKPDQEEPEEGEISDDNEGQEISVLDNGDKDASVEGDDVAVPLVETAPAAKASSSYGSRWSSRSNGESRHGAWALRSEASSYTVQPDKFYQFAWAKGVQESPDDSLGDSLQEERLPKSRKTGENSRALHRSGSGDRKSGWIVGDRGIEYAKVMRSDDGYFFLQEGGDRSDQRRGEGRRERSDRGSSERGGKSMSDKSSRDYRNHSEERSSAYDRERRRSETRRSSRDCRRRDGRGEGDLEEGEIELKQGTLADKAAIDRHMKGRDKDVGRPSDKAYLTGTGLVDYVCLSEPQKDKLITEIANNVRSVSVKDAQKSFMGVCCQLRRALRALRDLNKDLPRAQGKHIEGQQRKVLALTRDTFSGIRAAYAVRNTAVGKEQEQDTNAFPRLLELARNRCETLFTSKQLQELESMMQAIGYRSRVAELAKLPRKASHQLEKGEERDSKVGESSGNTSATTQLESESSTDNSANARTLELGDEAEQPLNLTVDLNICEISAEEQSLSAVDSSTAGTVGFGGWFSYGPEQGDAQEYNDAKEPESLSAATMRTMVDLNEDQNKSNSLLLPEGDMKDRNVLRSKTKNARGINNSGFVPHFDPVRDLTFYQEKFAGKSQATHNRLPSPTPSDEGGTVENNSNDVSIVGGYPAGKDEELPQASETNLFPPLIGPPGKENGGRATPSELTLFPSSELPTVEDGSSEGLQTKLAPPRGSKKSRDPRRRLDSQPLGLELQPETGGDEGSEQMQWLQESSMVLPGTKQQASQASQEALLPKGELVSLLTLATGGEWLPEQLQTSSTTADAGLQMTVDSSNSTEGPSQKKRQIDLLNEEISTKRPRTAVILKEGDVARPKGLELETVEAADISKQGPSDTISSQSGVLLKQSASGVESVVSDSSKPRMKPRDPRRALLGSILEKSKAMALGVAKGGSSAASSTEAVPQTNMDAVGSMSEPALIRNLTDKSNWTSSMVKNDNLPIERPVSSANVLVIARTSSLAKNESLPIAGSTSLLRDSDLSDNNGRSDDLSKISKVTVVDTKMNIAKPPGRFDLNLSAAKQRDNVNHWDHLEPLLEGLDEKQKQAVRQERARRIEEQSRMFVAKKLCLVLDLDHTLLNSAKFSEIEVEWEAKLQANELTERNKFGKEGSNRRELYRFQHMGMWTKLRPGIWNFLARASNLYELHVYTMGNKAYATEMAKLLDPTGTLFAGRVISKGDDGDIVDGDERPPKSKDLDGVLGMESAVVIIDDSARVWPHHRHNLIVVERYMYFPCSRKQFGLPGPSLLEVGHDEREQDGMLASALMVIEKIHYNFFSNPRLHEVDVRDILAKEQRKVLAGCKLVFSRVFPQGEIQPHLHPLWQLAEQFGAVCSMGIDDGVTHVVAISLGTEKVNWALSTGRSVVRPSWLEASAILYRRASERDFSVTA